MSDPDDTPVGTQYLDASLRPSADHRDPDLWRRPGGAPPSPEPRSDLHTPVLFESQTQDWEHTYLVRSGKTTVPVSPKKHHFTNSETTSRRNHQESSEQMLEIESFEIKMQQKEIAKFKASLDDPRLPEKEDLKSPGDF
eukprot:TRINITY_DN2519_c0_g1_i1.p1 TRINITY_DN2519_c0_g1~~TRINITY_DN2519_c0_g1_i1.p1  ORF type:complete len:139 (-),score=25.08 TRINITY_DN2519_c0_g1_i1:211-627(-)